MVPVHGVRHFKTYLNLAAAELHSIGKCPQLVQTQNIILELLHVYVYNRIRTFDMYFHGRLQKRMVHGHTDLNLRKWTEV